ncbi:hypothetical protein DWV97_08045 [Ruminococcus sp. AF14-10]|nr:hypothetical protein DWV97_08045 [Ruminococcus sp. AF14-10]
MTNDTKEAALKYAAIGIAVFPVIPPIGNEKSAGKKPYISNWQNEATTSKEKIIEWWTKWPDANIGIVTGRKSDGLVVIDLDIDDNKGINGYEVLKEWQRGHGNLPETWQSITGRGGYHLFYYDSVPHKSRVGIYEGVDIRGEGGYVIAPPSIHANGHRYEWEQWKEDGVGIAKVNDRVLSFIKGLEHHYEEKQGFKEPETIPEGERVNILIRLIGSLKAKGLENDSIMAAVCSENKNKCIPVLTDQELEKEVFPALNRDWKATNNYTTTAVQGKIVKKDSFSLEMMSMEDVEEKAPEWLIAGYVPRHQITVLAGDGGVGKTTAWCDIAASVSSGKPCFLERGIPEEFAKHDPGKVLFFSSEDSPEYTLKSRLMKAGANLANIFSIGLKDDRFSEIKFNSELLEQLIEHHKPELVIFDPIQSFVPPDIQMGQRNAMRACLNPLIGLGEKYGATFLVIVHANKQSGVYGRKRIADSADIWDIARSVMMIGNTAEQGVRYISHEKSNYGMTADSVLFSINDGKIETKGYTTKKDREFVSESTYNVKQAPAKEAAKEFIIESLQEGQKEASELNELAQILGISKSAMREAKAELKKEQIIKMKSAGFGAEKKWYISLVKGAHIPSEKTNR